MVSEVQPVPCKNPLSGFCFTLRFFRGCRSETIMWNLSNSSTKTMLQCKTENQTLQWWPYYFFHAGVPKSHSFFYSNCPVSRYIVNLYYCVSMSRHIEGCAPLPARKKCRLTLSDLYDCVLMSHIYTYNNKTTSFGDSRGNFLFCTILFLTDPQLRRQPEKIFWFAPPYL